MLENLNTSSSSHQSYQSQPVASDTVSRRAKLDFTQAISDSRVNGSISANNALPGYDRALDAAEDSVVQVGTSKSSGSGVLIGEDDKHYYIITNAHVVGPLRGSVDVLLPNGDKQKADVIKNNPRQAFNNKVDDLAIVRVEKKDNDFTVAELAKASPAIGDPVLQAGALQLANVSPPYGAITIPSVGSNRFAVSGVITEDRDPSDKNDQERIAGSYELGVSDGLPVSSSGGGTFNPDGYLVGLNGLGATERSALLQNGKAAFRENQDTSNWLIDTQTIREFAEGVIPGF